MKNKKLILLFAVAAMILLTASPVLAASADSNHLFGLDGKSRGAIMLIVAMLLLAGSLHFKKR